MSSFVKRIKKLVRNTFDPIEFAAKKDVLYLNEALNLELQCIFIAIPKTGTTTVREQIRPVGIPIIDEPHLSIMQVRDTMYTYLLMKNLSTNLKYPTEGVRTDAEVRQQCREVFESCFKFSAVRNPWARAVSLYFRREGVPVSKLMSFEDFCDQHIYASDTCRRPTLHKNQIDWLVDESGNIVMDYVYKLEEFDDAIKEIRDQTRGRINLVNQQANTNPESKSTKYRDMYNQRTKEIIASRFEKDVDYFKYAF